MFSSLGCHSIFLYKQKTAYEMRISDWSQTCALPISPRVPPLNHPPGGMGLALELAGSHEGSRAPYLRLSVRWRRHRTQLGRASCRERVCQDGSNPVVAGSFTKTTNLDLYRQ